VGASVGAFVGAFVGALVRMPAEGESVTISSVSPSVTGCSLNNKKRKEIQSPSMVRAFFLEWEHLWEQHLLAQLPQWVQQWVRSLGHSSKVLY